MATTAPLTGSTLSAVSTCGVETKDDDDETWCVDVREDAGVVTA